MAPHLVWLSGKFHGPRSLSGYSHFVGVHQIRVRHTRDIIFKSMQYIILVTWLIHTCLFVNMNTLQSTLLGLLWYTFFRPWKKKQRALNSHYLQHDSVTDDRLLSHCFLWKKEREIHRRKSHSKVKRNAWVSLAQPPSSTAGKPRHVDGWSPVASSPSQGTTFGSHVPRLQLWIFHNQHRRETVASTLNKENEMPQNKSIMFLLNTPCFAFCYYLRSRLNAKLKKKKVDNSLQITHSSITW